MIYPNQPPTELEFIAVETSQLFIDGINYIIIENVLKFNNGILLEPEIECYLTDESKNLLRC